MAASGSSVWPVLSAGNRARASEVETKFDWLEANVMPQLSGSTTDLAYDLGGTITAHWRSLYTGSLNPTSTARGVAIGTTTVANNSDVAFEVAGVRSMLIPRLTTTQRNNLAGVNGMFVYDSTLNSFRLYENGAWRAMAGITSIQEISSTFVISGLTSSVDMLVQTTAVVNINTVTVANTAVFLQGIKFGASIQTTTGIGVAQGSAELTGQTSTTLGIMLGGRGSSGGTGTTITVMAVVVEY